MKKTLPFCFILLVTACKQSEKSNIEKNISPKTSTKIDFINYPVDDLEGITGTGDEGVYRNFDFNYKDGETMFILIPKIGAKNWYSQQVTQYQGQDVDSMIDANLSKQSFKSLSKEFNICIFHTPKKYLKHTPNLDAPYTPKLPRKVFLYQYDSNKNIWNTIDTFAVNNENDEAEENKWREKMMSKLNSSDVNQSIVDYVRSKNETHKLILNKECDLNNDNLSDRVLVFSPRKIDAQNRFSTVYVLIHKPDEGLTEYSNSRIINAYNPNSYAEGFINISIKSNFFTIEENISTQPQQNKYTTFVFNKKNKSLDLHKLGFTTLYPDTSQDKEITYTSQDFGLVSFEKYDPKTIKY